jgi:hypothetical protein
MEIKRAAILIISDEASEDVANCLLDLEIVVRNYANCGEFPLFLLSQDRRKSSSRTRTRIAKTIFQHNGNKKGCYPDHLRRSLRGF